MQIISIMASRMIHYVIANKIIDQIRVENRSRFLIGCTLVPDASSHEDKSYNKAHCWDEISDPDHWGINWNLFSDAYGSLLLEDDLYLGYYLHLIQDALWFHDIVDVLMRIYPKPEQKPIYQKGYRDYLRLNYILREEYMLEPIPHNFQISVPFQSITEARLKEALCMFEKDFDAKHCTKQELELYKWDIVRDYIEKSVSLCVKEVKALREGKAGMQPEELFVTYHPIKDSSAVK